MTNNPQVQPTPHPDNSPEPGGGDSRPPESEVAAQLRAMAEAHERREYDLAPPVQAPGEATAGAPSRYPPQNHYQQFRTGTPPQPPAPGQYYGRRYGFLCQYCSSRLEAVESMAGQSGTCPTCGEAIVIPILDNRGRLIDPLSGKVIKQDPHPVHAYAAAGHKAPQIVPAENGDRAIKCPRCQRLNQIASNNCVTCGLPFTMEGTVGDAIAGTNTWAVASLVLGIVSVVGGCAFVIPPLLAVIFGAIALRGVSASGGQQRGNGLAIAGIIMGVVGLLMAMGFYGMNFIRP